MNSSRRICFGPWFAQKTLSYFPAKVLPYASSKRLDDRTMMGATPEEVARSLAEAGADVIGANCGQGIAGFVAVCRRLHAATDRPIWIKANAGMPELENGRAVYRTTPAAFASHAQALIDAGASFIGGCCGTTPEFIAELDRVDRARRA